MRKDLYYGVYIFLHLFKRDARGEKKRGRILKKKKSTYKKRERKDYRVRVHISLHITLYRSSGPMKGRGERRESTEEGKQKEEKEKRSG